VFETFRHSSIAMASANYLVAAADRISNKIVPIVRNLGTTGLQSVEQGHRVWTGPDSSNDSQNSDRESFGTPTPDPPRSTHKTLHALPAISRQSPDRLDLSDNIRPSSQIPKATSCASETNPGNNDDDSGMQLYDQYDLTAFSKEDFDMLLHLAPSDQIPEIMTSEIEADDPLDLPNRLKAVHKDVNRYVLSHEFVRNSDVTHTISERRAFERNVYDYARAKGVTNQLARDEVRRARMRCGERDYDTDDTSLGLEIDDTMEILEDLARTTIHPDPGQLTLSQTNNAPEQEHQKTQPRGKKRRRKSQAEGKQVAGAQDSRADGEQSHKDKHEKVRSASNKLEGKEISTSTSPCPDAESRHVRKKRKRQDVKAGNGTLDQSSKKKRARHPPHTNNERSTIGQRPNNANDDPVIKQVAAGIAPSQAMANVQNQATFQANEQAMLSAVREEKEPNEPDNTLVTTGEVQKALKREKKRKRRREKQDAESKSIPHGETTNSEGPQPPANGEGLNSATKTSASITVEDVAKAAKETHKAENMARKVEKRKKRAEQAKQKEQIMEHHHSMELPKNVVPALGVEAFSKTATESSDALPKTEEHRLASADSAAAKKRKKRKSVANEDSNETAVGTFPGNHDDIVPPKEIGPNDPKSQEEAHRNFMRSNEHDPQEHVLTPDKTPKEVQEAGEKQSRFVEKLGALKRFSNEKQIQLYEDGRYDNADKQTKDNLKDLKEEQRAIKEMVGSHPKVGNGLEEKQEKSPKKTKAKAEKAPKTEEDKTQGRSEMGEPTPSDAKVKKKRKRDQVKQETSSHTCTEESGFH